MNRPILSYLEGEGGAQIEARFWSYVDCSSDDACWDWTGGHFRYGRFKIASYESRHSNRVAWTIANRREPGDLVIRHTCDRPPCCNPRHLVSGTHQDNMDDKRARGRATSGPQGGEHNNAARLTLAEVGEIVAAFRRGETNMAISYRYPVGHSLISRIRTGRSWQREAATFGWTPRSKHEGIAA